MDVLTMSSDELRKRVPQGQVVLWGGRKGDIQLGGEIDREWRSMDSWDELLRLYAPIAKGFADLNRQVGVSAAAFARNISAAFSALDKSAE